jgi:xanthine dehydrogenase accessory factor
MDEVAGWLEAGAGPAVLVTVAATQGSVPRGPGTHMLVDAARQWGTVGGGHLELHAAETARAMLQEREPRGRLERCPLGPGLGQCCGGVVHLAFERAERDHLKAAAAHARNEDCWRAVALDGAPGLALFDAHGRPLDGTELPPDAPIFAFEGATRIVRAPDDRRWLLDRIAAPREHVLLFGAGHVGAAIVRLLANLPCRVTWADERADLFPYAAPANVAVEATDAPEALVGAAAPGTVFLVMTHSHALDQRLAEAILKRPGGQGDWFGLIGSHTKRKQFEHRLRERGIPPERLATMACPIGIPGIAGKEPAVIAVAVAAQLLMLFEQRRNSLPLQPGTT